MNNAKGKKILNIAVNAVLIIFLVICILAVSVTIMSGRDTDGAVNIFGYKMMIVTSGSMEKCEYTDVSDFDIKSIPVKSMIFIDTVPEDKAEADAWYKSLKVGDVLTFKYVQSNKQITITHRIVKIEPNGMGGYVIELMGDNKNTPEGTLVQRIDTSVNGSNFVIGKVVGKATAFGTIVTLLKSPLGIVLMIIIPCFIIIALEAYKIWKVVQDDKKQKADAAMSEKEREIEELKRQLAEMSQKTQPPTQNEASIEAQEPEGSEKSADEPEAGADASVSDENEAENDAETDENGAVEATEEENKSDESEVVEK